MITDFVKQRIADFKAFEYIVKTIKCSNIFQNNIRKLFRTSSLLFMYRSYDCSAKNF